MVQVNAAMMDGALLPWEVEANAAQFRKKMGFMAPMLLRMVARDPAKRPTLREVDSAWRSLLQEGTMTMM